jgi:hypothetical protein
MKLESYQANTVIANQNTDPKRHGACGNDGIITFSPPELRDAFIAEYAALVAVAEKCGNLLRSLEHHTLCGWVDIYAKTYASLATDRDAATAAVNKLAETRNQKPISPAS